MGELIDILAGRYGWTVEYILNELTLPEINILVKIVSDKISKSFSMAGLFKGLM